MISVKQPSFDKDDFFATFFGPTLASTEVKCPPTRLSRANQPAYKNCGVERSMADGGLGLVRPFVFPRHLFWVNTAFWSVIGMGYMLDSAPEVEDHSGG